MNAHDPVAIALILGSALVIVVILSFWYLRENAAHSRRLIELMRADLEPQKSDRALERLGRFEPDVKAYRMEVALERMAGSDQVPPPIREFAYWALHGKSPDGGRALDEYRPNL